MPVRLNGGLLRDLIDAIGGIDGFLDSWHVSSAGEDQLNKATIHRWINGQLPKNSEKFLRLSAVLDVDPFALLAVGEGNAREAVDEMLEIVQSGRSVPPALQFLRPFFGRRENWPPELAGHDGRPRAWHVREFEHDPGIRSNFYQTVELAGQAAPIECCPQVFHFAFRHPHMFGARWLQYGSVLRRDRKCTLWHINSYTAEVMARAENEPTRVETWFGPGQAIFRVASLHRFALAAGQARGGDRPTLRFPG